MGVEMCLLRDSSPVAIEEDERCKAVRIACLQNATDGQRCFSFTKMSLIAQKYNFVWKPPKSR
jgi:hypothetical protein